MILNKLRAELGYKTPDIPGMFGIEIETEVKDGSMYPKGFLVHTSTDDHGHAVYKNPTKYWVTKSDGSLRDFGIEFILRDPLSYEKSVEALHEFYQKTLEIPFSKDQPSTSVHVHMNFTNRTLLNLANFIMIWTAFENILLDFSGPTRKSNCFALGSRLAEQQVGNYVKMLKGIEARIANAICFDEQIAKYAALNIANLAKLGTLESRSFRGTTDIEEITLWLSILKRMMDFSETPGLTPSLFFSELHSKGYDEMMSDVFGSYSGMLKCEGYIEMIDRQEFYLLEIASSVKNWTTFGLQFATPPEKPKRNRKQEDFASLYGNVQISPDSSFWGAVSTAITIDEHDNNESPDFYEEE